MIGKNQDKQTSLHQIWWQLALFIAISAIAVFVGVSLKSKLAPFIPEEGTFPSIFNEKPSGYKALYEITKKVGIQTEPWQLPYRRLKDVKGTLVVIEPDQSLADFEVDEILSWVKAGNRLIVLDNFSFSFQRQIPDKLDMKITYAKPIEEDWVKVTGKDMLLQHVPGIIISAKWRISGGQPIVSDSQGAFLVETAYGSGSVIVGTIPNLCPNRRLTDKKAWSNFQFLENLFHSLGGTVWFDETCHGFVRASNVFFYLGKGAVGFVFFQMLLIFALLLASSSQRFGATKSNPATKRTSSLEFIKGLANTYRSARATNLAWEILSHSLVSRLNRALGVSADDDHKELCRIWAQTTKHPADELNSFLNNSEAMNTRENISEAELIELAAAYDKITETSQEILSAKRGSIIQ